METLDKNFTGNENVLTVNGSIISYLKTASKWTVLASVCLFLFGITGILGAVKSFYDLAQLGEYIGENPMMTVRRLTAFIQLIFGAGLILPGIFLIRFTISAKNAFKTLDQGDFDFAIKSLKNTLVFFALYLVTLIIAVITTVYLAIEAANQATL